MATERARVKVYRDDGHWEEYTKWFMRSNADLNSLFVTEAFVDYEPANVSWEEALALVVQYASERYPDHILVY